MVTESRIEGNTGVVSGIRTWGVAAVAKTQEGTVQLSSFMRDWRARQDESSAATRHAASRRTCYSTRRSEGLSTPRSRPNCSRSTSFARSGVTPESAVYQPSRLRIPGLRDFCLSTLPSFLRTGCRRSANAFTVTGVRLSFGMTGPSASRGRVWHVSVETKKARARRPALVHCPRRSRSSPVRLREPGKSGHSWELRSQPE